MKFAIDVHAQSPGAATGALSLYVQLARFLPKRDPGTDYLFFCGSDDAEYYQSKSDGIRVVPVGLGNRHHFWRLFTEHFLLGWAHRHEQVDVIFHSGPGVAPLIMPGKGKLILAVWAMHHVFAKDLGPLRKLYRALFFARSLKRADVLLVNSEYTKALLREHYPEFTAPVKVIRHGVDLVLFNPDPPSDAEKASLAKNNIKGPYVLFVGQIYPYKLLHILVEAFCRAVTEAGLPHQLVVVGSFAKAIAGMGTDYRDRLIAVMDSYSVADRWVTGEDINVRDLRALYAGADVYVQSSSSETFGRTVIEAMACGCPTVAADAAATPEILGDAGLYYPAEDVPALKTQLLRVLQDKALAAELRRKGLERVKDFSFDGEVAQLIKLFHETAQSPT